VLGATAVEGAAAGAEGAARRGGSQGSGAAGCRGGVPDGRTAPCRLLARQCLPGGGCSHALHAWFGSAAGNRTCCLARQAAGRWSLQWTVCRHWEAGARAQINCMHTSSGCAGGSGEGRGAGTCGRARGRGRASLAGAASAAGWGGAAARRAPAALCRAGAAGVQRRVAGHAGGQRRRRRGAVLGLLQRRALQRAAPGPQIESIPGRSSLGLVRQPPTLVALAPTKLRDHVQPW
jgi:hypothetical protein